MSFLTKKGYKIEQDSDSILKAGIKIKSEAGICQSIPMRYMQKWFKIVLKERAGSQTAFT